MENLIIFCLASKRKVAGDGEMENRSLGKIQWCQMSSRIHDGKKSARSVFTAHIGGKVSPIWVSNICHLAGAEQRVFAAPPPPLIREKFLRCETYYVWIDIDRETW